jgi:hypothetical protein
MANVAVIQALRSMLIQFLAEQVPPSKVIRIPFCGELLGYSTYDKEAFDFLHSI